jgi:hypothetical protein
MRLALVGGVTTLALLAAGTGLASGPECSEAKKDLERAQQALSKATRDADTKGAAYAQCIQGAAQVGGRCATEKAAYDAALSARARAQSAFKAASSRQKAVCDSV